MELKQMVCSHPLAKMAVQGWEGPQRAEPEGIFSEKSYQGEEAFYNGPFTAWSQRLRRKILKLFDHFGYHCIFSNPNSWPKKAEDFPGLVLHPSEPGSLRPFFALLGNVCLSAVRTYIGCVIIQTWRGCFLASAALIAAGGAVEK